jgi:hypothetical protein
VRLRLRVREPVRRALRAAVAVSGGEPAGPPAPLSHRHRVHLAHASPLPGHRPAAPWCRRGRGGPAAHPPELDDDLADLPPSRRRGPARRAGPLRRLGEGRPDTSAGDAHATSGDALRLVDPVGDDLERRYAADAWRAAELGIPAARGRGGVSFTEIDRPWLRQATKRWARHRLATGCAFNTIRVDVFAIQYFSRFLAEHDPPVLHPEQRSTAGSSNGIWPGWRRSDLPTAPRRRSARTCESCWRTTAATAGSPQSRPTR